MGYMAHHGIMVTAWCRRHIEKPHQKAVELGMCVSEISKEVTNGYHSFAIFPDGSKEGWTESDEGDKKRFEFMAWMKKDNGYCDAVEFRFGGDDPDLSVINRRQGFVEFGQ